MEDDIINFDITQEVTEQMHNIEIEVAKNTTVEHLLAYEELPHSQIEIKAAFKTHMEPIESLQKQTGEEQVAQVFEEIGDISSLFDGLKEESTLLQLEEAQTDMVLVKRPMGYVSSAEEETKHNRSTAVFQLKTNNFMSSDEDKNSARR